MDRSQKLLLSGLLGLAILAGPVASACAACCPVGDAGIAVAAMPDCCGDCGATLDRAPDPAAITAARLGLDPSAVSCLAIAPVAGSRIDFARVAAPFGVAALAAPPRPLPPPLRL